MGDASPHESTARPLDTLDRSHTGTAWTDLWSLESLRYRGSGWWFDRILPDSPVGLLVVAFVVPIAWFVLGYVLAGDRHAYLSTHDVTGQLWFFPLHVIVLRITGSLWATHLGPACDGLAMSQDAQTRIRRGALGRGASIGALLACAYFITRDISFGFSPNAAGLIPFDDPEMWDMAALGRPVHLMMVGLWCVEWAMFGYLLWLQLWILIKWLAQLRKTDFRPHLGPILIRNGYVHSFTLFSQTTTVSLVFALGNLGFIAFTGELIPREVVQISSVGDFFQQMSDLLSTSLLFLLTLIAVVAFVRVLRGGLTRAVNEEFSSLGDDTLSSLEHDLALTGDSVADLAALRDRANAQSAIMRAVMFQREVEVVGGRTILAIVAKAFLPLLTSALKLRKLFGL